MIDAATIRDVTGLDVPADLRFETLGWANSPAPGTLSFIDQAKYLPELLANENVEGVFALPELAEKIGASERTLHVIACDDPRWAYHILYNHVAERDYERRDNRISATARIHPAAFIGEHNVTIGERTVIGPNATILPDVTIGDDCVVQSGTVIGSVGFEQKRTSRGMLAVVHDGTVEIGDRVEIGSNCCVDKGFKGRSTMIGDDTRLDNLVHVAHAVRIGRRTLVTAGTIFAGSTVVGDDAWLSINSSIGPSLKLGHRSFVSMAAAVGRDVPEGEQVTGNLALPHKLYLKIFKALIREGSKG